MTEVKKRAPTLYGIIIIKLVKGVTFLSSAIVAYRLSENDLPVAFHNVLHWLRLNPERRFYVYLATQVGRLTEANVLWVAAGTLAYSFLALTEGIGLMFRVSWASWLTILESGVFLPIELYELRHNDSLAVLIILLLNLIIFWYLLLNRKRLFHRAHLLHHASSAKP
jgi:uncharacterized membrane protein (DUF2068 family)